MFKRLSLIIIIAILLGIKHEAILYTKITELSERIIITIQKALETGAPVRCRVASDQIYIYEVSVKEISDYKNRVVGKLLNSKI